ncbi:hypothetical protein Cgig2_024775 [Carnegiea gigantea]|uniref:Copper transport protein n=1 Tax=Carnegiea gigantea TaxID=171969 RepID=A0A9Q1JGZ2_9CARY|nr:hypothetical protein Cgig2_024775 [Carnegiea gigantea]
MHLPIITVDHHHLTAALTPSLPPSLLPLQPPLASSGPHRMVFHKVFYWGKAHEILFPGWPGSSTAMYVLAVLFVFFSAVIVECLSYCRAGVHAVRAGFAYMVLLAVVSYNGGVFIAAVVGHSIGYLVCGSGLCWKNDGTSSPSAEVPPPKF